MVTICPFCVIKTIPIIVFIFPSGMRTYYDGMPDISHTSTEIVSMLSNREVKIAF